MQEGGKSQAPRGASRRPPTAQRAKLPLGVFAEPRACKSTAHAPSRKACRQGRVLQSNANDLIIPPLAMSLYPQIWEVAAGTALQAGQHSEAKGGRTGWKPSQELQPLACLSYSRQISSPTPCRRCRRNSALAKGSDRSSADCLTETETQVHPQDILMDCMQPFAIGRSCEILLWHY